MAMQTFTILTPKSENANDKEIKIVLEGDLSLQNAAQIKKALVGKDKKFQSVEITCRDITAIDVSVIQILEAYRKSITAAHKMIKIVMDLPYDLKTLLDNAGLKYQSK